MLQAACAQAQAETAAICDKQDETHANVSSVVKEADARLRSLADTLSQLQAEKEHVAALTRALAASEEVAHDAHDKMTISEADKRTANECAQVAREEASEAQHVCCSVRAKVAEETARAQHAIAELTEKSSLNAKRVHKHRFVCGRLLRHRVYRSCAWFLFHHHQSSVFHSAWHVLTGSTSCPNLPTGHFRNDGICNDVHINFWAKPCMEQS